MGRIKQHFGMKIKIVGTPVMVDEFGQFGNMTPCVGETPYNMMGGRTSEYGTPGASIHDAAFSPGFNALCSPAYASPHGGYLNSPGYGSPASPSYGANRIK